MARFSMNAAARDRRAAAEALFGGGTRTSGPNGPEVEARTSSSIEDKVGTRTSPPIGDKVEPSNIPANWPAGSALAELPPFSVRVDEVVKFETPIGPNRLHLGEARVSLLVAGIRLEIRRISVFKTQEGAYARLPYFKDSDGRKVNYIWISSPLISEAIRAAVETAFDKLTEGRNHE
jgi:hypothetical protein